MFSSTSPNKKWAAAVETYFVGVERFREAFRAVNSSVPVPDENMLFTFIASCAMHASPKSASFTRPCASTKIFPGCRAIEVNSKI
jgi:hypothetical protein